MDIERIVIKSLKYDNKNRHLVYKHKWDNNAKEILAQNTYNEFFQLQIKKEVDKLLSNSLTSIDYTYNIHKWIPQIMTIITWEVNCFHIILTIEFYACSDKKYSNLLIRYLRI